MEGGMLTYFRVIGLALALGAPVCCAAAPVHIVAAENFYGNVASQIAGDQAQITSILNNPNEDPHLFEVSPQGARQIARAQIVIYSGIDYDPWIDGLLRATKSSVRQSIDVASLIGRKPGDNPHIWYDPATMAAFARALAADLTADDPAHQALYQQNLAAFTQSLHHLTAQIGQLRGKYAGLPVAATEPVFGYMASALGLDMHEAGFQLAVMNNTEPSAAEVGRFEDDLRQHKVRLFIYNSQATDPAAQSMLAIARKSHIPVIGVTETMPAGVNYQGWMSNQLTALDHALGGDKTAP
jgi:zinc/manganese transport system substrate-binding protein